MSQHDLHCFRQPPAGNAEVVYFHYVPGTRVPPSSQPTPPALLESLLPRLPRMTHTAKI